LMAPLMVIVRCERSLGRQNTAQPTSEETHA
jgi:hypothetical protein